MNTSGINRLQSLQYQTQLDKESHGREDVKNAVDDHADQVQTAYKQSLVEIQKEKEARESRSLFTLLGAIFLGPLIGSAIGGAVGDAANDGDEGAAREAKKQSEIASLQADKAFDRFEDARGELEKTQKQAQDVQKFARELRDSGWVGTN